MLEGILDMCDVGKVPVAMNIVCLEEFREHSALIGGTSESPEDPRQG